MTLSADMVSDLTDVFYDTDEFAETATYTPSGGSAVSVTVIPEEANPPLMEDAPPDDTLIIRARTSEVADPSLGDTFTIDGDIWHLLQNLGRAAPGEIRLLLTRSDKRRV